MTTDQDSLVTAVMITQPSRMELAAQAIKCFQEQSYEPKRLLIVVEEAWMESKLKVNSNIDVLLINDAINLGDLRNRALHHVKKGLLIQWDDDDLYRSDRIAIQAAPLLADNKLQATLLRSQLVIIEDSQFHRQQDSGIDGTIMHRVPAMARYPVLEKGEDTIFLREFERSSMLVIDNEPNMYIRRFHGNNTWDFQHFMRIKGAEITIAN